jgi:hypothetical protein
MVTRDRERRAGSRRLPGRLRSVLVSALWREVKEGTGESSPFERVYQLNLLLTLIHRRTFKQGSKRVPNNQR